MLSHTQRESRETTSTFTLVPCPLKEPEKGLSAHSRQTSRDPFAHKATSSRSPRPVHPLRELNARLLSRSPTRPNQGLSSFGGKSGVGRRFTRKNRKGPLRHRGSTFCSERPVRQHRQLSSRRLVQSASQSDSVSRVFGRNTEFFVPKNQKNSLFSKKRLDRHSSPHT